MIDTCGQRGYKLLAGSTKAEAWGSRDRRRRNRGAPEFPRVWTTPTNPNYWRGPQRRRLGAAGDQRRRNWGAPESPGDWATPTNPTRAAVPMSATYTHPLSVARCRQDASNLNASRRKHVCLVPPTVLLKGRGFSPHSPLGIFELQNKSKH